MEQEFSGHYYTDAMANYLIIHCPKEALEGYQYRMLAVNRIEGLLSCSLRTIDGESFLYYETTSCQSLAHRYHHQTIPGREMKQLLYAITGMMGRLSQFLLDDSGLYLNPESVYYEPERNQYRFVYYPEKRQEGTLQGFLNYLAEKTDPSAADSTAVIFRLCDLASIPGFVLKEDTLNLEYEAAQPEREEEPVPELFCSESAEDGGDAAAADLQLRRGSFYASVNKDPGQDREEVFKTAAGGEKPKKEAAGTGRILVLAVGFLALAGGLQAALMLHAWGEQAVLALRAGVIAGLAMAVLTSVYGMIYLFRRDRRERGKEVAGRESR